MPPKYVYLTKKKNNKKLENINYEMFESEYNECHKIEANSDELKFIQLFGKSQLFLEKMNDIQKNQLDAKLVPIISNDKILLNAVNKNLHNIFGTTFFHSLKDIKFKEINTSQFNELVNLGQSLEFQFNDEESSTFEAFKLKNLPLNEENMRTGHIFNTGGLPLTLEWCPLTINKSKFLFVAVAEHNSDIHEFSTSKCALSIFEVTENREVKMRKQIIIDSIIKEIEFPQISNSTATLLKLTLSNGSVEIWKIDSNFLSNNVKFCTLSSGNYVFKLPKSFLITTSAFSSTETILVGTNFGYIGQFSISSQKLDYLIATKTTSITSIRSALPTDESDESIVAFFSSTELKTYCVKLPLPGKNIGTILNNFDVIEMPLLSRQCKFNHQESFNNNLKCFATLELPHCIKFFSVSDPSNHFLLIRIDENLISSFCFQTNNLNGLITEGVFLISGHANGSIRICNFMDAQLASKDKKYFTLKTLQMKKLSDKDSKYCLQLIHKLESSNNVKQNSASKSVKFKPIYHDGVNTIKVSMMDNAMSCIWGNGLLLIEDIII